MPAPQKACPVVIRDRDGLTQILAFRHPVAGLRIVKGSIEAGETPATAAARELEEESGIVGTAVTDLGSASIGDPPARWHVFGVATGDLPDEWSHRTSDDQGHVFAFFRHPLDVVPDAEWHVSFREALAYIVLARTRIGHGVPASPPLDLARARSGPDRGPP